uniref:sensor histidine kinase n=1 Tax=Candidatus Electrothrix sp. TaxID=2170559 RepID=UPI00405629BC
MPPLARYGSAVLVVVAALGVRWMLAPLLGGQAPLLIFVLAVVVAAWYGGFGSGMLATALSALAGAHFFIEPARSLWIAETPDQVRLVIFLLGGWLISALSSALHAARFDALSRAEEARRQAERAEEHAAKLTRVVEEAESLNRELEAANRATEEARQKADAAARAQSQFLSTMSHEIRTPINAIMGYTDLLQMGVAGSLTPRQDEYLTKAKAASQHLLGLVNDVLDLAKVDAGAMTIRAEPTPLRGTAIGAVSMVEPQASARGIKVEENSACAADAVYCGDEDRVRQILINLLSNAVKFTEPGGRVTVRCRIAVTPPPEAQLEGRGPWVSIEVEDTGVGIPAEQAARVFEPFVQVEGGPVRPKGGTGLGL